MAKHNDYFNVGGQLYACKKMLCYYNSITVLIILQNYKLLTRAIMLVDISDV